MSKVALTADCNQWSSDWLHAKINEIAKMEADSIVEMGFCDREHIKDGNLRANAMKAWLESSYPAGNA